MTFSNYKVVILGLLWMILSACGAGGGDQPASFGSTIPDFIVTDIEVTQGTQNLDNDMPLVAGRRTIVRVHVDDKNAKGASNVSALLEVFRVCPGAGCQGQLSPFKVGELSPSNPGGRINVPSGTTDRSDINQAFWFYIPNQWIRDAGRIRFKATINAGNALTETNLDNNETIVSLEFLTSKNLKIRAVPLHLHENWNSRNPVQLYDCNNQNNKQEFWDVFLNMFRFIPIKGLEISCAEPLFPMFHDSTSTEFPAAEWDMGSAGICLQVNDEMFVLKSYENLGPEWNYVGLAHPDAGPYCFPGVGWSGTSWVVMKTDLNQNAPFYETSGYIAAHEVAHRRLNHVSCKGNEGPPNGKIDPDYPFPAPDCRISKNDERAFFGTDVYWNLWPRVITRPTILPSTGNPATVFPLMGYQGPVQWTDSYAYCEMLNAYVISFSFSCDRRSIDPAIGGIVFTPPRTPVSNPDIDSIKTSARLMLVSGVVQKSGANAAVFRFVALQDRTDVFKSTINESVESLYLAQTEKSFSQFALRIVDRYGKEIYRMRIPNTRNNHIKSNWLSFSQVLPFPVQGLGLSEAVQLLDTSTSPEKILAEKIRSVSTPVLSVDSTPSGITNWSANDIDGNSVHYTVRYSPNRGKTWHVLQLASSNKTLNTRTLDNVPGSLNGMIEIIANDGFNTSRYRSAAVIVVPDAAPRVYIAAPQEKRSYGIGDTIILSATVSDAEDSFIPDSDIIWRDVTNTVIGTGREFTPPTGTFSAGAHTIQLSVIDSNRNSTKRIVSFQIK